MTSTGSSPLSITVAEKYLILIVTTKSFIHLGVINANFIGLKVYIK
jgi:hypothetical protein